MDVLDKYKDAWKNQSADTQTVSKLDIYKITQQKSSSIVKWIFIIGILEFAFWILLNIALPIEKAVEIYDKLHLTTIFRVFVVFHYVVIVIFLYYFYKNYSSISVIDDTKVLLKKILSTRKTVKYYVLYNILGTIIMSSVFCALIVNQPNGIETFFKMQGLNIPSENMLATFILVQGIVLAVFLAFIFVFYQLLYGRLLRKLKRNYKELAKLEASN